MADEQIIYLSPEEELTNVRERLEQIQSRRIILVIPTQTLLRSLVGWRLLHSRARELGKDVLVISSDRQIRSVVKAAGFKVADSLESPPTSRARPGSRPARTNLGGKTSPQLRTPPRKAPSDQRSGSWRNRPPNHYGSIRDPHPIQQESDVQSSPEDNITSKEISPAASTFEQQDKEFGPNYDFRIEDAPSLHPLGTEAEDEEYPDLFLEDFQRAQSIRQAAQTKETNLVPPLEPEHIAPPEVMPQAYDTPPAANKPADPLEYLEDFQPAALAEQRGSVSIDDIGNDIPDIADYPTGVLTDSEIEDQGDMGDFVVYPDASPHSWPPPEQEAEQDIPGPSRVHGVRPRSSRTGKVVPQPLQPDSESEDDEQELPPIHVPSTRIVPPGPTEQPPDLPSSVGDRAPFAGGQSEPKAVSLPQPRSVQPKSTRPKPARPRVRVGRAGAVVGTSTAGRSIQRPATSQPPRRRGGNIWLPVAVAILIILMLGVLAYIGPSADVTVSVPANSFPLSMSFTASAASQLDIVHHTIPAQTVVFDTSITGTGQATGSTKVGTNKATGTVVFTNNGTQAVDIPTGTIISTSTGVQFVTTADLLVLTSGSSAGTPNLTTIEAQNPGAVGNVAANSITVIPAKSLSKIQQANPSIAVKLSVTNTDATSGGGVGNATTVTARDVNTQKAILDQQAHIQVQDWLKKQVHTGDQPGQPILGETVTPDPAVGNIVNDGTFKETVRYHVTVLVVRANEIQAAATAQLNEALRKSKQFADYSLLQAQPVPLTQLKDTPTKDGSSLALSFTALGQIVPKDLAHMVRTQLAGKRLSSLTTGQNVKGVQHYFITNPTNTPGSTNKALDTTITLYPGFFPSLPSWPDRINVHVEPVPVKTAPK